MLPPISWTEFTTLYVVGIYYECNNMHIMLT